jgi:PAS domain-containing protein
MGILTKQTFEDTPQPKRYAQTIDLEDLERALAAGNPGASVVISRTDRQYRYTYISSGVEQITGLPVAAFIGRSLPIPGIDPLVAARLAKARADVHHAMKPSHIEIAYPARSGMRYYRTAIVPEHDDQGRTPSSLTVSIDVTAEKQLTNMSMHLQPAMALEVAGMAVWNWDMAEDMNHWSPRFAELFGFGANDKWHSNQEWADRIHPEDRPAVLACLQNALQCRGTFASEYRIEVPGRGIRSLQALGRVTARNADGPVQFLGIVLDVTDAQTANALEGKDPLQFAPAFTLCGRIFAWRCNGCGKLFMPTLEDAEDTTASPRLMNEFRRHRCPAHVHKQHPDVPVQIKRCG